MRRPTPHASAAPRIVVVGLVSALALGACGAADNVDAVAGIQTGNGQVDASAPSTSVVATVPVSTAQVASAQAAPDEGGVQRPGLPVASGQVEVTQVTRPSGDASSIPSLMTTTAAPAIPATTASPATEAPTTRAPTTQPPVAANLPTNAVLDLVSGSSLSFPQAVQSNGLPVLLWFWSPT